MLSIHWALALAWRLNYRGGMYSWTIEDVSEDAEAQEKAYSLSPAALALLRSKGKACDSALDNLSVASLLATGVKKAVARYDLEAVEKRSSALVETLERVEHAIDEADQTIDDWWVEAHYSVSGSKALYDAQDKMEGLYGVYQRVGKTIADLLVLPGQTTAPALDGDVLSAAVYSRSRELARYCAVAQRSFRLRRVGRVAGSGRCAIRRGQDGPE